MTQFSASIIWIILLGRILDFVLGFGKNLTDQSFLLPEFPQQVHIMGFEFSALFCFQALPVVFLWNGNLPFVILSVFIGHFQKQQIGELFQVIAVAHPVIPQGVAETPDF